MARSIYKRPIFEWNVRLSRSLQPVDAALVDDLRAGDEDASVARAEEVAQHGENGIIYASSKRAVAEWARTAAISAEWAGAGIPLNGVGPGVIVTPMTEPILATEEGRATLLSGVPMPLYGQARGGRRGPAPHLAHK
jgi:NAD(P)-dependent dehydrogenase (short-subunit alcohol dehydrogenase family)